MSVLPAPRLLKTYQWTTALVIEDSRIIAPDVGRQKTWMWIACWSGGSATGGSGPVLRAHGRDGHVTIDQLSPSSDRASRSTTPRRASRGTTGRLVPWASWLML